MIIMYFDPVIPLKQRVRLQIRLKDVHLTVTIMLAGNVYKHNDIDTIKVTGVKTYSSYNHLMVKNTSIVHAQDV